MKYVERVEYNLRGLHAVSTGVCGGCVECMELADYVVDEDAADRTLEDIERDQRRGRFLFTTEAEAMAAFDEAVSSGEVCFDAHFSWSSCGICNSGLGGDREVWHALVVEEGKPISEWKPVHFDDACVDCVCFIANGTLPGDAEEEDTA